MSRNREDLDAPSGDEYRLICPLCRTIFNTVYMPTTCPTCSAELTIKAKKQK
jgi:rRNA maturation endonuclease Nob1